MAVKSNQAFSLLGDLRRRHVFRVAALYIVGAWLLLQIADVIFPGLGIPEASIRYVMIAALVGFPIALVVGWMYELTPDGIVRTSPLSESTGVSDLSLRGTDYAILGALVLVAVSVTYGLIVQMDDVVEVEPASVERMAFPLPDKPSIAVLPFDNMSDDAGQEYFVDGMTEDLITDLSKISGLFVIARNSVFTYKGTAVKVQEVAEDLGVRYVLEGSVRKAGNSVRINAQLIDAVTGGHVWAERYDDNAEDIFALQDRITEKIVSALELNLSQTEQFFDRGTTSPEAHDAFLRGWAHFRRNTPEAFAKAVPYFEQAIEFDPDYSLAHAALATVYWKVLDKSWSTRNDAWVAFQKISWEVATERFTDNLRRAMEDPGALAYQAMAFKYSMQGRHDEAVAEAENAIAVDPNNPLGYEALAATLIYSGQPEDGAEAIRGAMRLDPRYPYEYLFWLGLAQFNMEQFEKAAETLGQATQGNPEDDRALILLAATYGQLGRVEEAQFAAEAQNLVRERRNAQRPDKDVSEEGIESFLLGPYALEDVDLWLFQESRDRERLREGLRVAGLPEFGESSDVSPFFVTGARTIDVIEAKQQYDRGVVFIDVRDVTDSRIGRIKGAVSMDSEMKFTEEALNAVVKHDEAVVIYCHGSRCLRSSKAVIMAVSWGFTNVYYFRDGFPAWKNAGHPFDID
jgi:TolB-like protein/Tfp pilus assembly protein PilF/rhodanese-related sulfurtransferase